MCFSLKRSTPNPSTSPTPPAAETCYHALRGHSSSQSQSVPQTPAMHAGRHPPSTAYHSSPHTRSYPPAQFLSRSPSPLQSADVAACGRIGKVSRQCLLETAHMAHRHAAPTEFPTQPSTLKDSLPTTVPQLHPIATYAARPQHRRARHLFPPQQTARISRPRHHPSTSPPPPSARERLASHTRSTAIRAMKYGRYSLQKLLDSPVSTPRPATVAVPPIPSRHACRSLLQWPYRQTPHGGQPPAAPPFLQSTEGRAPEHGAASPARIRKPVAARHQAPPTQASHRMPVKPQQLDCPSSSWQLATDYWKLIPQRPLSLAKLRFPRADNLCRPA